jgi:hypothetical protein
MVNKILNRRPKKAWIRIVEAVIAIMILSGVLLTLYVKNSTSRDLSFYVYNIQKTVLDKIGSEPLLRTAVLNNNADTMRTINDSIKGDIPPNLDFYIKICDLGKEEDCSFDKGEVLEQGKEIYTSDRRIIAEGNLFNPKNVRLFLWQK